MTVTLCANHYTTLHLTLALPSLICSVHLISLRTVLQFALLNTHKTYNITMLGYFMNHGNETLVGLSYSLKFKNYATLLPNALN